MARQMGEGGVRREGERREDEERVMMMMKDEMRREREKKEENERLKAHKMALLKKELDEQMQVRSE